MSLRWRLILIAVFCAIAVGIGYDDPTQIWRDAKGLAAELSAEVGFDQLVPQEAQAPIAKQTATPMPTPKPYDIKLPEPLRTDLASMIDYALSSGAAKHLGEDDFCSCSVLLHESVYERKYSEAYAGTLSSLFDGMAGDYFGLLCRTGIGRLDTMHSLLVWREGQPKEVGLSDLREDLMWHSRAPRATDPIDLAVDVVGGLYLSFYPASSGEIALSNGVNLEVEVEYPSVYVMNHPLMKVDLE